MSILCSDNVTLLKYRFFFMRGSLSVVSKFLIDGMGVVALAPATNTTSVSPILSTHMFLTLKSSLKLRL